MLPLKLKILTTNNKPSLLISNMFYLYYGDIAELHVEAIVNPAHNSIIGQAGLAGHINKAGGEKLLEKCNEHGEIKTGQAFLTYGYDLPAKHVIHTLGPMWLGGGSGELTKLEICYINCLTLALQHSIREIAFPAISTGLDGFPPREATQVALRVLSNYLDEREGEIDVILCCFNEDTFEATKIELKERGIEYVNFTNSEPI
jgi:O-acetyl-ADP-ribose deacetylase